MTLSHAQIPVYPARHEYLGSNVFSFNEELFELGATSLRHRHQGQPRQVALPPRCLNNVWKPATCSSPNPARTTSSEHWFQSRRHAILPTSALVGTERQDDLLIQRHRHLDPPPPLSCRSARISPSENTIDETSVTTPPPIATSNSTLAPPPLPHGSPSPVCTLVPANTPGVDFLPYPLASRG